MRNNDVFLWMWILAVNTAFRLHACLTISNWVILHGGRVFNKMRNDVIGECIYLYDSLTSRWYELPIILSNQNQEQEKIQKPDLKRFGHVLANIKDELIILGGALNDDECTNQILKLTLSWYAILFLYKIYFRNNNNKFKTKLSCYESVRCRQKSARSKQQTKQ